MKKSVFAFILTSLVSLCYAQQNNYNYKNEALNNAVIYEANIRQYSKAGTFNAFTSDIPKLKKLGIKIICLMPIFDISSKKQKITNGNLVNDQTFSEKNKKYGYHYSIKNYRSVDNSYGTINDFDKLVETAHQNGMEVILDWVTNYTALDHKWVKNKSNFYLRDKNGKLISPFDWTDVAKLNFENKKLRKTMTADMKFWLTKHQVDGFRSNAAVDMPKNFWIEASAELHKVKPIFMLSETENSGLLNKSFDMQNGLTVYQIFNNIYKGENTVKDFDLYMSKIQENNSENFYMNFTSNHSENFWNGTEYERMNKAVETFAVLSFLMPGFPLIHNGQEYDLNKRLKFFEKDEIPHKEGKMMVIYEKLASLKLKNPALNSGKNSAAYKRIKTSNDESLLVFEREKNGKKIIFLANLSKTNTSGYIDTEGEFVDYFTGNEINLSQGENISFSPWQFYIFEK